MLENAPALLAAIAGIIAVVLMLRGAALEGVALLLLAVAILVLVLAG